MNDCTPEVPTKQCSKCKEWFPRTTEYFYRDKKTRDGLWARCKTCQGKKPVLLAREGYKFCIKCEKDFPATTDYFYARESSSDGFRNECKACYSEKNRVRRKSNAEYFREKAKEYGRKNKEKLSQKALRYRLDNAERLREYRRTTAEQRKKRMDAWRAKNVEHEKEKGREYRKNNLEKLRLRNHEYIARKVALPANFTDDDWQISLDWWGGRCAYCGNQQGFFRNMTMCIEHFVPLRSLDCPGTIPKNIVPSCISCNNSKSDKDATAWLIGKFGKKRAKTILAKIQDFFSKVRQV